MSDHSGRSVLPKKNLKIGKKNWCFLPRGPPKRLRPPLICGLLQCAVTGTVELYFAATATTILYCSLRFYSSPKAEVLVMCLYLGSSD